MSGITHDNLMLSLPAVLADDKYMNALASSVAGVLSARVREIDEINIYRRIDELDEELLDILAYDFKVDWWDYSLTLGEKRETLKQSWYVHRHMATPASVKAALSAVYSETECEEWYEYGGLPYHFRLSMTLDAGDILSTKHERVLALLRFYKNLRSVLDHILYIVSTPMNYVLSVDSCVGQGLMITTLPEILPELIFEDVILPLPGQLNVTDTVLPEAERRSYLRAYGEDDTIVVVGDAGAEGKDGTVGLDYKDAAASGNGGTAMIIG